MSLLSSIRIQVIILIALLMIVPVLIMGTSGILYYRDVVKHNIWDDNLAQAKAISALTSNYIDLSVNYLQSLSHRPLVITAIETGNSTYLNVTTKYAAQESIEFDSVFITDVYGNVLSYHSISESQPYPDQVGKNYFEQPFVYKVLNTSAPYISDGMPNIIDGSPTVYIGVPILDFNNTTIGVLAGSMDLMNYTNTVVGTQVKNRQYIFLVNRTGHAMVHINHSYMNNMTDFSILPAVGNVIRGQEGVVEQEFPFENDVRLVSYAPIPRYGWGTVVSLPVNVAYQPIDESTRVFIVMIIALLIVAAILSFFIGDYITDPLLRISNAIIQIPEADPKTLEKKLPLQRKDEIGNLARSLLAMANTMRSDRTRIISAWDKAEDERLRAELYLDIMGHDINNLNQVAQMNLELIKDDPGFSREERESIEASLIATHGSAAIIDNVRKLQQIADGRLEPQIVDLNDLILDCIKEAPYPVGKIIKINYTPRKGLNVKGAHLMKEIFCNLINNSIKYSNDEVTIDILAGETHVEGKKYYQVTVADNGHGIPDDVKPKLFTRFQRGTTKAQGKGLGLYIVRTLLDKFGGSVKLEDRVTGDYTKGSKFIVTLPAT